MKSVNDILREVMENVSVRYGGHISFLFGDWDYIANQLMLWGTGSQASKRYPIVCLRSPYSEQRSSDRVVTIEIAILVNTLKNYTNEQRERESFIKVLRPIYNLLLEELSHHPSLKSPYVGLPPHVYSENYRYGRLGLSGGDEHKFKDFVDAIEITNLRLTIKNQKCNE